MTNRFTPDELRFIAARVYATWGGPPYGESDRPAIYRNNVCRRGHVDPPRRSSGHCLVCDQERTAMRSARRREARR